MTRIIELAHALGEEIAKSNEIKNLEAAKAASFRENSVSMKPKESFSARSFQRNPTKWMKEQLQTFAQE